MRWVYDLVYGIACLLSSPLWGYRLLRTRKWRTDWPGRFGFVPPKPDNDHRPTLLIHAVSVGEVDAVRLLVSQAARQTRGGWRIVIATTTDTGYARACSLYEPTHAVVRYPLDFGAAVHRFLDRVQPNLVALAELEVWPNFVRACQKRAIPVCVVNGRLSARSYKRYRLVRWLVRPTFAKLAAAAVQTEDYAQRFVGLGVQPDCISVLDSMKWDTAELTEQVEGADALAAAMGIDPARPLIVAGSTGPGEEKLLIETCPPGVQLLLAPRKPERFDEVAELAAGYGPVVRRSKLPTSDFQLPIANCQRAESDIGNRKLAIENPCPVFLLDTIGELKQAYALADVAVVGRSFLGLFGSNVLEPIALGKPTIVGPFHSDFADVVSVLQQADGIVVTDQPGNVCAQLLQDRQRAAALAENGRAAILLRQGATQRHVELLLKLMPLACLTLPSTGP